MAKFSVTYELVNQEEADVGETDRRGFLLENAPLRDAIAELGGFANEADSWPISLNCPPRWLTADHGQDMYTGDYEQRSLHIPEGVSASSRLRIARLLGVKIGR